MLLANKKIIEEYKFILRATKNIKNPTARRKILEYFFTALIARYAEERVNNLVDKSLERILNSTFLYERGSKKSKT